MRNIVLVMMLLGSLIAPTAAGAIEGEGEVTTRALWGKVTDSASGHPIDSICIEVFEEGVQTDYWARTSLEGYYEMSVAPGTYVVEFTECEGGVFDTATADAVVTGDADVRVDMSLDLADGFGAVAGSVVDAATQEPVAGVCVKLYEAADDIYVAYRPTNEAGTYQVYAAPGEYRVRFKPCDADGYLEQWWDHANSWDSSTSVVVTNGGHTAGIDADLEIDPYEDGLIWGHVVDGSTGDAVAGYCVSMYDGETKIFTKVTGELGGYEIPVAPGEYRVKAWACEGAADKGTVWYLDGDAFETAKVIAVEPGHEVPLDSIVVGDVRFRDALDSQFHDDIVWLAKEGITQGCTIDGTEFCPNEKVTRAQMAAFLHRALGDLLEPMYEPGDFADVEPGSIFAADIAWLASVGITLGCDAEGNLFCPDDEVNRGQMAAFLYRALSDILEPGEGGGFIDDDGSAFEDEIDWLAGVGVTSGCDAEGTAFCPDDDVIRSHMAAFLHRALVDAGA